MSDQGAVDVNPGVAVAVVLAGTGGVLWVQLGDAWPWAALAVVLTVVAPVAGRAVNARRSR